MVSNCPNLHEVWQASRGSCLSVEQSPAPGKIVTAVSLEVSHWYCPLLEILGLVELSEPMIGRHSVQGSRKTSVYLPDDRLSFWVECEDSFA